MRITEKTRMQEQKQMQEIYSRLRQLKEEGVRMKDIATAGGWSPSVLSALYASVLPLFCTAVNSGKDFDQALDKALASVNNLSRKRLMADLDSLYRSITDFHPRRPAVCDAGHPFLHTLQDMCCDSLARVSGVEGMYMSYSCSSSMQALKAEPFYLTASARTGCLTAGRQSVHGSLREGIGLVSGRQMLYLLFNAFREPGFSLVSVYLQLPFLEKVSFLKGLYLVPDYNMNPIARRIVLVKCADCYDAEEFTCMEARLIMPDALTDEEQTIYQYVCTPADSIKMCTLPSPKLDLRDLAAEKKLLSHEGEWNG